MGNFSLSTVSYNHPTALNPDLAVPTKTSYTSTDVLQTKSFSNNSTSLVAYTSVVKVTAPRALPAD